MRDLESEEGQEAEKARQCKGKLKGMEDEPILEIKSVPVGMGDLERNGVCERNKNDITGRGRGEGKPE